jgi:hypothetical protein
METCGDGNNGVTLAGNTPQQLGGPRPSATPPYNGNNRIIGANYDAAGNQTAVNGNTLAYDAENRVMSALDGVTQSTETYLYDGDGQRQSVHSGLGPGRRNGGQAHLNPSGNSHVPGTVADGPITFRMLCHVLRT